MTDYLVWMTNDFETREEVTSSSPEKAAEDYLSWRYRAVYNLRFATRSSTVDVSVATFVHNGESGKEYKFTVRGKLVPTYYARRVILGEGNG